LLGFACLSVSLGARSFLGKGKEREKKREREREKRERERKRKEEQLLRYNLRKSVEKNKVAISR
jgi:hypothetical protein